MAKTPRDAAALRKATKLLGQPAFISRDQKAPKAAERQRLRDEKKKIEDSTALSPEEKRKKKAVIVSQLMQYRVSIGFITTVGGIDFFHVKGQGDSVKEALAELERANGKNL